MQIQWTELAEKDLENIEAFIAEENHPTHTINTVLTIIDTVYLILSEHPRAGRFGKVKGTRELVIDKQPLMIIYRVVERTNQVEILRVLHNKQKWP